MSQYFNSAHRFVLFSVVYYVFSFELGGGGGFQEQKSPFSVVFFFLLLFFFFLLLLLLFVGLLVVVFSCCCFFCLGLAWLLLFWVGWAKEKNHTSSHIPLIRPSFNIKYSLKIQVYTDIYSPVTVKYTQEFLFVTFISNSSLTNKQNITISRV